jgi:hypothetical protein
MPRPTAARIGVDMKGKLLFLVGLGAGYVLGTRAGRERYEQIARAADKVWNQPTVQKGVDTVKDFASEKLGDVSDTVLDNVKQFIGSQTSKGRTQAKPAASGAAPKPSTARSNGAGSTGTKANGTSNGSTSSPRSDSSATSES